MLVWAYSGPIKLAGREEGGKLIWWSGEGEKMGRGEHEGWGRGEVLGMGRMGEKGGMRLVTAGAPAPFRSERCLESN